MTGKITGPLREQSDWEQQDENRLGFIKNKPFYDTRKSEEWTLTLDASTFKKEDVLGNILLKISDKTMSVEEFGKVRYRVYMDGEMVLENTGEATEEAGGYACCGLIMYLEEKQVGLAHVTPGLYLPISEEDLAEGIEPGRCFYEFYFPSITTGELKTLDEKFLPPPLEVWFLFESLEPEGWARGYRKADFTDENLLLPQEVYEAYKVGRPIHVRLASTTIGERADFFRPPILGLEVLAIGGVCEEFIIKSSMSPFNSDSTSLSVFEIDIYEGE